MTTRVEAEPSRQQRWSRKKIVNLIAGISLAWIAVISAVASIVHLGVDPQPRTCLPWRFYLVRQRIPAEIVRGEIYVYRAHRIPLMPEGTKVTKYVAAVPGDQVEVSERGVSINGHLWGPLNAEVMGKAGISVASVARSYRVPPGKALMLGTQPSSWDGRYWGLVDQNMIVAKATPLW